MREASPRLILEQKEAVAEMQRPFAFRIFPHRKCAGLVSLWVFCTFSGSEIAQMAVFYGRYSSFSDILVHFQDDKISLNVQSCEKLLHLSIFRRASEARHSVRHTARHFFKSKAQIRHILTVSHPLQNRKAHDLYRVFNGQSWVFLWCARGNSNPWPSD